MVVRTEKAHRILPICERQMGKIYAFLFGTRVSGAPFADSGISAVCCLVSRQLRGDVVCGSG